MLSLQFGFNRFNKAGIIQDKVKYCGYSYILQLTVTDTIR